jgi:hypothetical protein
MKDYTKQEFENGGPGVTALHGINFCLERIYADRDKSSTDDVVADLAFKELIGALIAAREELMAAADRRG